MHFTAGALIMIGVPMAFRLFAAAAVGRWPLWVQIVCLSAWGVLLAALFFASVCFILVQQQTLTLAPGPSSQVGIESLSDFFVWQFAEAVPLLDMPATLKWDVPLT